MSSQCPQCGNINRSSDTHCLKCGFRLSPTTQPIYQQVPPHIIYTKKKTVWQYFFLAALALGALGWAISSYEKKQSAFDSSPSSEFAIQVSATDLYSAYEANEVDADNRYKGKLLLVTGRIDSIGKDIADTSYVALSNGRAYSIATVQCMFNREGGLGNLRKGQSITVRGRCDGKLMNVILKDCVITK